MKAFGHFLLGSHNFMVMALGSCVRWLLVVIFSVDDKPRFYRAPLRFSRERVMHFR